MDTISFGSIIRSIKKAKWLFVINAFIAIAIGVTVALSIPKTYESSSSLAAESKTDNPLGGSMGSLASLAGVNLSKSNDAIVPELYPSVVVTNDFLVSLLSTKVRAKGMTKDVTYLDYLENYTTDPWWTKISGKIKDFFSSDKNKDTKTDIKNINPEELTKSQDALISSMKGNILCTLDGSEDGVINIKVYTQDPYVSKKMVETVTARLQTFITEYRTNKVRVDLAYYQRLKKEAYDKYIKAQRKYADYSDSHMDLSLKSYQLESDALENDLQLMYNNYSQACQQVTLAEAKVQERTPVFTVLERPVVAPYADSPKKKMIVMGYLFVFMAGTLCFVILRDYVFKPKKKENSENADDIVDTENIVNEPVTIEE